MSLFSKEQIESFMQQTRENIANAEMVLAKNPNIGNAEDLKSLIKSQKKSLEKYESEWSENRETEDGRD